MSSFSHLILLRLHQQRTDKPALWAAPIPSTPACFFIFLVSRLFTCSPFFSLHYHFILLEFHLWTVDIPSTLLPTRASRLSWCNKKLDGTFSHFVLHQRNSIASLLLLYGLCYLCKRNSMEFGGNLLPSN